jgi:3'(2'), 5'-bisphosphate nucleotidase
MSQYNKELSLAVNLIKKASEITEWFKERGAETFIKRDHSPVTLADFSVQVFVLSQLKEFYPEDQVIAEENESDLITKKSENSIKECFKELDIGEITDIKSILSYRGQSSERQWAVDPIDGTKGFMEGLTYAIGISLLDDSKSKMCAISVPTYNEKDQAIFVAETGQGAKVSYNNNNFELIHVSRQNDIKNARLCQSLHYDLPWVTQFADKIGIQHRIQIDSMAKFCMVADGSYDLYIKPLMGFHVATWDYSQGDLLVREAGGRVTDLDEEHLVFKNEKCKLRAPGIITSNGILHDEVSIFIRDNFFSI